MSRLTFAYPSVDAIYASEALAKQILMQDKEWSARGRECIFIHDRARVANILTYPRKRCERGTRDEEIASDEEWSKEVESAYFHT